MMSALLCLAAAWLSGGIQDEKAIEAAIEAFKAGMRSPSEADRVSAVNELAKIHHHKTLARLAALLESDGPTVRIAAAKGISGFTEIKKQAAPVLAAALGVNAKDSTVHAALYEAIGHLEEPSSVSALHQGFEEKETAVAKAAISATGQVGSAASIDPLIAFLTRLEKIQKAAGSGIDVTAPVPGGAGGSVTIRSSESQGKRAQELIPLVNKALGEITHESHATAESWSAWWAKNRGSFKPFK